GLRLLGLPGTPAAGAKEPGRVPSVSRKEETPVIARQMVPGPLPQSPPAQPWLWSQRWLNPLFAHWQVPAAALRPHVPAGLGLDTWQGTAWVTVVAFRLAR